MWILIIIIIVGIIIWYHNRVVQSHKESQKEHIIEYYSFIKLGFNDPHDVETMFTILGGRVCFLNDEISIQYELIHKKIHSSSVTVYSCREILLEEWVLIERNTLTEKIIVYRPDQYHIPILECYNK
ncbi:MAG: hypothetical protein ACK5MK_14890 [Dysgonomonas sp.]